MYLRCVKTMICRCQNVPHASYSSVGSFEKYSKLSTKCSNKLLHQHMRSGSTSTHQKLMMSSNTESGYIIRQATQDDFPGIRWMSKLALKDGYKTDYVSGILPKLHADPNRLIYVAENNSDKSVIGFAMGLGGLDKGLTYHIEAGRSHPDYQSQGLVNKITVSMATAFSRKWPDWKYFRATSTDTNYYDHQVRDQINMLCERIVVRFSAAPETLQTYLSSHTKQKKCDLNHLSPSQYSTLLSDYNQSNFFYPEDYIVLEHNVFNAWSSNVPYITSYHENIFQSGDADQQNGSLSVGGHLPVDDDKAWRYNFNYTGVTDLSVCEAHLREHISEHLRCNPTKKDNHFILMMPKTFKDKFGETSLKEYWKNCFHLSLEDIMFLNQYIFNYKGRIYGRIYAAKSNLSKI